MKGQQNIAANIMLIYAMLHSKKFNKYFHIIEIIIFILTLSILSLNII